MASLLIAGHLNSWRLQLGASVVGSFWKRDCKLAKIPLQGPSFPLLKFALDAPVEVPNRLLKCEPDFKMVKIKTLQMGALEHKHCSLTVYIGLVFALRAL